MSSFLPIQRALISVSDKSTVLKFAQALIHYNVKLISTEKTSKILSNFGLPVQHVSDYTKFPEIMHGRIKTLHHKIYASILCDRNLDNATINQYNIQPIDMIIVDFYPFSSIIKNTQFSHEEILEYIDIGGLSMARAAAKNYKNVVILVNNNNYKNILNEMSKQNGCISLKTRFNLAVQAFQSIAEYDSAISNYFHRQSLIHSKISIENINHHTPPSCLFPSTLNIMHLKFKKQQNTRYGENPHQQAALYIEEQMQPNTGSVATSQQLQGKPLSYNNIIDMEAALECVKTFNEPTCVIVKHTNPCGVATDNSICTAYLKAYQSDPISAFGGIIAFNRPLDKITAQTIIQQQFVEAIIAPSIHQDSLSILENKKHIRVLSSGKWQLSQSNIDLKRINGGLLIQESDTMLNLKDLEIVTIRKPTKIEMQDSLFCWKIVKFVKSNAIVCGKNYQTTGIGTGQTSRVYAVKMATSSQPRRIPGSVMASDAFFPFLDGIDIAIKMGIHCIIQPGGSIRDPEIIKLANHHGIAMIFTHIRHFKH